MPEVLVFSSPRVIKKICIHPYTFHGVHAIPNFLRWNQFRSRDHLRYKFGDHLLIWAKLELSYTEIGLLSKARHIKNEKN